MTIYLHDLLALVPGAHAVGSANPPITALAYDSRRVTPGMLFVAVRGHHSDGHTFIQQAIARGAAAVAVDARYYDLEAAPLPVPVVQLPNSLSAIGPLAACLAGYPGRNLRVVGITGTKGKSTTSAITAAVLEADGAKSGMISTVAFKIGAEERANTTRQSTPEAPEVQAMLAEMAAAQCRFAVVEATSHALSAGWNRLAGCGFDTAVMLNVTHEHLDYHGSFAQYRSDKTRLFSLLHEDLGKQGPKFAVVNGDDPNHEHFLAAAPTSARALRFGLADHNDLRATTISAGPTGAYLQFTSPWGAGELNLRLPGRFNALNALAALGVALCEGVTLPNAIRALEAVRGVKGRMEPIVAGQPFAVIVDYAHNPDSFEQVMSMLRPLVSGRMIAVFGSAGERDVEKRAIQGQIAARYCELLVLTDEDPRGEDREAIIAQIASGAAQAGHQALPASLPPQAHGYCCLADRRLAVAAAIGNAQAGDLVLLLGKGHEGSIIYAHGSETWDEAQEAYAALAALGFRAEL